MKRKEFIMRNKSALLVAGVLAGMASPGSVFAESNYPRVSAPDINRMRRDVLHVGCDFDSVINKEYGKQKTKQSK